MDVYLLCIGIEGADDRVAWSVLIVEPEGFVEEISGLASSPERAILWAIKEGLQNAPSKSNIAIRSLHTPLIRYGEHTLSTYTLDEAIETEDNDLLVPIIKRMRTQKIVWMNPPYMEPGDSRAQKIANDIIQDPYSSYPPEEVDFITEQFRLESERESSCLKEDTSDVIHSDSKSFLQEERDRHEKSDLPKEDQISPNEESIRISIVNEQPSAYVESVAETYESPSHLAVEDQADFVHKDRIYINNEPLASKPPPPAFPNIKKPHLLIEESPDYLFGSRILAYVDGVGSGNLGAWSFILIDKKTGSALIRASGLRASNPYRSRLLACIEVLSAIKASCQEIEIRSRWQNLIKLGEQWMHTWKDKNWNKSGNEPIQELGFIQQLYAICSQHRVQWQYIPDHNDEHGIQLCKKHVQEALSLINAGHKAIYNERIKNFPMEKLL